jgi:hypothetical protein
MTIPVKQQLLSAALPSSRALESSNTYLMLAIASIMVAVT